MDLEDFDLNRILNKRYDESFISMTGPKVEGEVHVLN